MHADRRPPWRTALEAVSGGAIGGLLVGAAELAALLAVGTERAALVAWAPTALGGYALAGALPGLFVGAACVLRPGLRGPTSCATRAALLVAAAGAGAVVGLTIAEERSLRALLLALGLGAPAALGAWLLRRPLERPLAVLCERRAVALPLGLVAAAAIVLAFPRLLHLEPWSGLGAVGIRAGSAAAALGVGALVLAGAWLASSAGTAAPRRAAAWVLASAAGVGAIALAFAVWPRLGAPAERAPNVLLVVIDTLRADRLSPYGYAREVSPALADLAGRGTVFEDAVSTASLTMPSTASLLTGRLPVEHGVRFHPSPLPGEEVTLAEVLRARGYATGAVVSNPLLTRRWGFGQGFDFFDAVGESPLGAGERIALLDALGRLRPRGARGDHTAASARRFLRRHRDEPFLLWVHFIDPHFPYAPPAAWGARFGSEDGGRYDELLRAIREGEMTVDDVATDPALSSALLDEGASRYDAEIAFTDHQVASLLRTLEELGLAEETLVVLTSDHGEALGEHGLAFEHSLNTYEELMHVPLILAWPDRVPAGRRVDAQVSLVDLAPTVLDLLGIEVPAAMRGQSLAPLLAEDPPDWRARPAYGENAPLLPGHPTFTGVSRYPHIHRPGIEGKWRMVRAHPWKLIHVPGRPEGETLLFHLERDPREQHDRAREHPEVTRELLAHLERSLAQEPTDGGATLPEVAPEELEKLRALGYAR